MYCPLPLCLRLWLLPLLSVRLQSLLPPHCKDVIRSIYKVIWYPQRILIPPNFWAHFAICECFCAKISVIFRTILVNLKFDCGEYLWLLHVYTQGWEPNHTLARRPNWSLMRPRLEWVLYNVVSAARAEAKEKDLWDWMEAYCQCWQNDQYLAKANNLLKMYVLRKCEMPLK